LGSPSEALICQVWCLKHITECSTLRWSEFGELPLTCVTCSVPTTCPPGEANLESTDVSGRDVFEEIVDVDTIQNLRDPFRESLVELIKSHGAA
jgi:hypothetical protein